MAKLKLLIFDCWEISEKMNTLKDFLETVDVMIGAEGERGVAFYRFYVYSLDALENELNTSDESPYLHYYIVLKNYDKEAIKAHVENLIQQANELCESNSDAFNYLNRHLKPEAEEWLY